MAASAALGALHAVHCELRWQSMPCKSIWLAVLAAAVIAFVLVSYFGCLFGSSDLHKSINPMDWSIPGLIVFTAAVLFVLGAILGISLNLCCDKQRILASVRGRTLNQYLYGVAAEWKRPSNDYPSSESGELMQGWLEVEENNIISRVLMRRIMPYHPFYENNILFMKHAEQAQATSIQAHTFDHRRRSSAVFGREKINAPLLLGVYLNGASHEIEVRRGGTVKAFKSRLHTMPELSAPEARYQRVFYAGGELDDSLIWGDFNEHLEDGAAVIVMEVVDAPPPPAMDHAHGSTIQVLDSLVSNAKSARCAPGGRWRQQRQAVHERQMPLPMCMCH